MSPSPGVCAGICNAPGSSSHCVTPATSHQKANMSNERSRSAARRPRQTCDPRGHGDRQLESATYRRLAYAARKGSQIAKDLATILTGQME